MAAIALTMASFQSAPDPKTGREGRLVGAGRESRTVSIRSRPEGRERV